MLSENAEERFWEVSNFTYPPLLGKVSNGYTGTSLLCGS
jgi:hypothetical protein